MGKVSKDDHCLIKGLRHEKGWSSRRLLTELPNKKSSRTSLDRLLKKVDSIGTTERQKGSGHPRCVRTATNIALVQELLCSQEDKPQTHKSPREIERQTGIRRSSFNVLRSMTCTWERSSECPVSSLTTTAGRKDSRDASNCCGDFRMYVWMYVWQRMVHRWKDIYSRHTH